MPETESHPEVIEDALFARVAKGDVSAFEALYDRIEGLLYGLILRILRDEREAEDVLQEAAVQVWERAPQYNPALGRPMSWVIALVRNRAIDRLRLVRRRSDLLERAAGDLNQALDASRGNGPGVEVECLEGAAEVRSMLIQLPAEQRQALELAYFSGLSQSEIAEVLGQPLGTVKARIRRGMLALRDALEGRR